MKIKQEDGTEIEVFTEAEVQVKTKEAETAAAAAAIEKFKEENPDKTEELTAAQTKLKEAEDALKKAEEDAGGDKDGQVARLRKERDDAKKAAEEATSGIEKKFEDFKKEMVGDTKTELLERLSAKDPELKKKIELEFDNYRPNDTSKKGIEQRMEKAYQLATGNLPKPGLLDGSIGAGDRGDGGSYHVDGEAKEMTPNAKAIGAVLGVTDAERKVAEDYKKSKGQ